MKKFALLAGAAALGLSAQAFGYSASGTVTFSWGGSSSSALSDASLDGAANTAADIGWTANGTSSLSSISNSTYFTTMSGYNSRSFYNADFATASSCAATIPTTGTLTATRKYGCRYNTYGLNPSFIALPVSDAAAPTTGASATGSITVTDTTLTGVLTINSTTDEPTGATTTFLSSGVRVSNSVGNGLDGYNYRSADGSPFGNVWNGITTAGTITLNLTGTFTNGSWQINGGAATFSDSGFACQQGGNSTPADILCTRSSVVGGFTGTGGSLSWGADVDGASTGSTVSSPITVRDGAGLNIVETLSGVLASVSVSGGNVTTNQGEFRRALGSSGCGGINHIRYDGTKVSCGTLTTGLLNISGSVVESVVPVPAAVWLMGSALGLLGWMRRKVAA